MADKFHKRCCFNCRHHLDFHLMGRYAETVVCAIRARKDMGNYIGVDYDQRKADLREYRKQHPKPYYLN